MREICVLALLSLVQSASALPPKRLAADELPKGSVILEGKAPGYLLVKVKDGKVVGFEAATEKTGNVTVSFEKIKAGTMVTFKSRVAAAVKFDLYLSNDRQQFTYTSSCPLGANLSLFENWPYPVPFLAITSAGPAPATGGSCE